MVSVSKLVLVFILANFIASGSSLCEQSCGSERVNYPFGFSDGCEIRLNCSESGVAELAGFPIHNVTSENIIVRLPTKCERKVDEIKLLFGQNYAVSGKNALLLQNCSSLQNNCTIPTSILENQFMLRGCDPLKRHGNLSCYPPSDRGIEMLSYESVVGTHCGLLLSSVVVDPGSEDSDVSLEFQTIRLDWWMNGACNCSRNADCVLVKDANGSSGYRCSCIDGFNGDGFVHGSGCRRATGEGKRATIFVLIGGIIAGASAVLFLSLICYFLRRHSLSFRSRQSAKRLLFSAGNSSIHLYPYREIERATSGFSAHKTLGTGAYGTVYEGHLPNHQCVAIKKLRHRDTDSVEQVMNEIKLISSVSHPNLVRLLGCCIENGEQILVYEFMPNGTLAQHLQLEKGRALPWTVRLAIATETAHAIEYLHSTMDPPIYHRDIKSSNILLDFNYNSKVADFGLSRVGMPETSHISTAPQGTPGYVDPQYHQNYHLSDKSDVYSFGVVLVEIITAMKVVDFSRPHSEINLAALAVDRIGKGRLDEIIDPSLEPHRDAWTLSSIHRAAELAFRCLAYHKDTRPTMAEVAAELEHIRATAWAVMEETGSISSSCSSPFNGSERSLGSVVSKGAVAGRRVVVPAKGVGGCLAAVEEVKDGSPVSKGAVAGRRVVVPAKGVGGCLAAVEEVKDGSPVSVQDPWFSANSSPSAHSLLGNAVR